MMQSFSLTQYNGHYFVINEIDQRYFGRVASGREKFAVSHRAPQNPPRRCVSRYACRHALRKAHDSSNETHNRAICINDAPSDSERTAPSLQKSHPPLSSSSTSFSLASSFIRFVLRSTVSTRSPR